MWWRVWIIGVCLLSNRVQAAEYSFGVLAQRNAVLSAEYWNPILDYVSRKAGVQLALKTARTTPESNLATERGEYDFVLSNTIFRPTMAAANYQVILAPLGEGISGQLVTLENSTIQRLGQLQGLQVGFPSPEAFVGYLVPMAYLQQQGLHVDPVFGGNQEGIMGQLKAGKVLAAGVNSQVMRSYAERERLYYRVLWESPLYPNLPIAVHPRVDASVRAAVQQAFAEMAADGEGQRILAHSADVLKQSPPYGFRVANQTDYQVYSEFYRTAQLKGLK